MSARRGTAGWPTRSTAREIKRPGLLVEWRQDDVRWEGRVVYAAQLRPGVWVTVEEWLPAALLTPL